ncbi:MAG: phosphatase PAP2 family protein [Firmicutes bacterium]|nr:phosphatase PAP2 family protein [Bacillota bacterium]
MPIIYNRVKASKTLTSLTVYLKKYVSKIYALAYFAGGVCLFLNGNAKLLSYMALPFIVLCYTLVMRKMIGRKRSFSALDIKPLLGHDNNGSCPSNHSAASMIIALSLADIHPILGAVFIALSLLTGTSRIAAGVHYPLDVSLGRLIAIAVKCIHIAARAVI